MRRALLLPALLVAAATAPLALSAAPAAASTPASESVTVPTEAGVTITRHWTGSVNPGVGPTSDCTLSPLADAHTVALTAPGAGISASYAFTITWQGTGDLVLDVTSGGSSLGASDGSTNAESVTLYDLTSGSYSALACPFTNAVPTAYDGTLVIKTTAKGSASSAAGPRTTRTFPIVIGGDPTTDPTTVETRIVTRRVTVTAPSRGLAATGAPAGLALAGAALVAAGAALGRRRAAPRS